jgi:hypothetical protein
VEEWRLWRQESGKRNLSTQLRWENPVKKKWPPHLHWLHPWHITETPEAKGSSADDHATMPK